MAPNINFDNGCLVLGQSLANARWKAIAAFDDRRKMWVAEPFRWRELTGWQSSWTVGKGGLGFRLNLPPLREYQATSFTKWVESGYWGCLQLPTGAGKTRVALETLRLGVEKILILVPTRVLLRQWCEVLRAAGVPSAGQWGDGVHRDGKCVVATFASAVLHLPREGGNFDLLIVDEAHHLAAEKHSHIARLCNAPMRLGLSATFPSEPQEATKIGTVLGPLVHRLQPWQLPPGVLSLFERKIEPIRMQAEHLKEWNRLLPRVQPILAAAANMNSKNSWARVVQAAGRFKHGRSTLGAWMNLQSSLWRSPHVFERVAVALAKEETKRVIVFCQNTEEALLHSCRLGFPCILSGINSKERDFWLEEFRAGKIRGLVTCKVLNEGYDLPDVDHCVIIGDAGQEKDYLQRLGRSLRPRDGKKVLVQEFVIAGSSSSRKMSERERILTQEFGRLHATALSG